MEVEGEDITAVGVSTPEATPGTAGETTTGAIVAVTTEVAAVTAGAEDIGADTVTAGAEDIGADTVTAGAGDGGGRTGVGAGDIRPITTARGITRPAFIILTRTTIPTIPRAIRVLTTGTTILRRQIPTDGHNPTSTDHQDPGAPRNREAHSARTAQTATSRPLRSVGWFSPLTG